MEEIKKIISPTLTLLKELNVKVGKGEVDGDFILKLSTTMKLSAIGLDKYVKQNKLSITGGLTKPPVDDDDGE
jgi:hypothetical protein